MTALDEWHVSDHELERYANHAIPTFARASVEAHLLACDRCRSALTQAHTSPARRVGVDETWAQIADRIDVTRRPLRSSTTALQVSTSSPLLLLATLGVAFGVIVSVAIVGSRAESFVAAVRDVGAAGARARCRAGVPDRDRPRRPTRPGHAARVGPASVPAGDAVVRRGTRGGSGLECLRPGRPRRRGRLVAAGPRVDLTGRGDLDMDRSESGRTGADRGVGDGGVGLVVGVETTRYPARCGRSRG